MEFLPSFSPLSFFLAHFKELSKDVIYTLSVKVPVMIYSSLKAKKPSYFLGEIITCLGINCSVAKFLP